MLRAIDGALERHHVELKLLRVGQEVRTTEVLATLDESTYTPRMKIAVIDRDLRMGDDHPIIWTHCIGKGRAMFSALGHQEAAYSEPKHLVFLEEAVAWLMSTPPKGCEIPDAS